MKKRFLIFWMALALIAATAVAASAADSYLLGDADADGSVTILDVTVIQRVDVKITVERFDENAADVDGNGKAEIIDAAWIQRKLAQFTVPYPVGELISVPEPTSAPTDAPTAAPEPTRDPYELPFIPR